MGSWVFRLNPNHFGLKVHFQYCIHSKIVVFLRLLLFTLYIYFWAKLFKASLANELISCQNVNSSSKYNI